MLARSKHWFMQCTLLYLPLCWPVVDSHCSWWWQVLWSRGTRKELAQHLFHLAATSRHMKACEACVSMPLFKREEQTYEVTSRPSPLYHIQKQEWESGKAPKLAFPNLQVLTCHHYLHHLLLCLIWVSWLWRIWFDDDDNDTDNVFRWWVTSHWAWNAFDCCFVSWSATMSIWLHHAHPPSRYESERKRVTLHLQVSLPSTIYNQSTYLDWDAENWSNPRHSTPRRSAMSEQLEASPTSILTMRSAMLAHLGQTRKWVSLVAEGYVRWQYLFLACAYAWSAGAFHTSFSTHLFSHLHVCVHIVRARRLLLRP